MESHEEKVYKAMRETQEKEAKQKMLERAEEIRRAKMADKQMHRSSGMGGIGNTSHSGGFGSHNYTNTGGGGGGTGISSNEPSSYDSHPPSFGGSSTSSNKLASTTSNKAMKLGTNKDALPAFIEQQARISVPNSTVSKSAGGGVDSSTVGSGSTTQTPQEK